ncbi:MAG: hypothetical protein ACI97A_002505 [Planctomycetota bacterium]|jgi:hypothetical protein
MKSVALQNLTAELVHNFERRNNVKVNAKNMVELLGFAQAKTIEAFLDGRILRENRDDILAAVQSLGGNDHDASAILLLCAGRDIAKLGIDEEAIVLNDRLMGRLQNMERFLRRIGKLSDFHDWLSEDVNRKPRESAREAQAE